MRYLRRCWVYTLPGSSSAADPCNRESVEGGVQKRWDLHLWVLKWRQRSQHTVCEGRYHLLLPLLQPLSACGVAVLGYPPSGCFIGQSPAQPVAPQLGMQSRVMLSMAMLSTAEEGASTRVVCLFGKGESSGRCLLTQGMQIFPVPHSAAPDPTCLWEPKAGFRLGCTGEVRGTEPVPS